MRMFQIVSLIQFKCSLVVTQTTQLKKIQFFSTRIFFSSIWKKTRKCNCRNCFINKQLRAFLLMVHRIIYCWQICLFLLNTSNNLEQGFPTFFLHCPPKSKIIKPASPHAFVSLVRRPLEVEGLQVKKNLIFASCVLL